MKRRIQSCLVVVGLVGFAMASAEPPPTSPAIRLEPASPAPRTRQLMRRWHGDVRRELSPVIREWRAVERATGAPSGRVLTAGCRRLGRSLEGLGPDRLPPAPDPSVSLHLEETLTALAEAADSCTQGAWFLTTWRLARAERSWRELRARLLLYDLAP